jgi:putative acetyltransferase
MDILMRNEQEDDYRNVEEITREAFWNLYFPGCSEHYLMHQMRNHPDFIKDLDFVAEYNGKVVGNIMYTKAQLIDEEDFKEDIISFGPFSILPEFQRKGIGSSLISHTKKIAIDKGIKAIVILGDPHNYCKHGFKSSRDYHISDLDGNYPYGLLVLELEEGVLSGHKWKYKYSDVYELNEKDVEEYDKTFPKKEKGYQYSQEIFSIAYRAYIK